MLKNGSAGRLPEMEEVRPLEDLPPAVLMDLSGSRGDQEKASAEFSEQHPDLAEDEIDWMMGWLQVHAPTMRAEGKSYPAILSECYLHLVQHNLISGPTLRLPTGEKRALIEAWVAFFTGRPDASTEEAAWMLKWLGEHVTAMSGEGFDAGHIIERTYAALLRNRMLNGGSPFPVSHDE